MTDKDGMTVIKIPRPVVTLTLVAIGCWWGYSILSPLASWYEAIVDKNTVLIKAETEAEAYQVLIGIPK